MFAIVYRCRKEGLLLDRVAIQADPVRGDLQVQRKGMKRVACLLGADGERYLVPLLDKVKLLAINDRGVLLSGNELIPPRGIKGMGVLFPQTWWCVLRGGSPRAADPATARARERERLAQQFGASMAGGHAERRGRFDPADID